MRAAVVAALFISGFGGRAPALATALRRGGRRQRSGVGAEHLEEAGRLAGGAQRRGYRLVRASAIEIEIEEVFPGRVAARPGLQLAEVDAEFVEAGQQPVKRARLVGNGADQRGFPPIPRSLDPRRSRPPRSSTADQEEARDVFLDGLDPLGLDRQAVELGRAPAGDGGLLRLGFPLHLAGAARGVVDRDRLQSFADDECITLRASLRMRQYPRQLPALRPRQDERTVVDLE